MKHTKGPWMVEHLSAGYVILGDVSGQDELGAKHTETVAEVGQIANAQLIAAAPELLAFVQMLVEGAEGDKAEPADLLERAKDLIAKAEGK